MAEPDQSASSAASDGEAGPTIEAEVVEDGPRQDLAGGMARVAVHAWWSTTRWSVGTSLRAGRRLAEAAVSPDSASQLGSDVRRAVGGYVRDLAGTRELDERIRSAVPGPVASAAESTGIAERLRSGGERPASEREPLEGVTLREQGAALMQRSCDVRYEEDAHPAYERIINEIAPDEGRILRLLMLNGPQPSVDVRTGGPLGLLTSDLVASGLTMIGARAGCRYVDRVPAYLNNLYRLGMVWFSRETLADVHRYQVIEAQPDVLGAMHSVRFPKLVRRSIHLTPFGEDFCREALMIDDAEAHPAHKKPADE